MGTSGDGGGWLDVPPPWPDSSPLRPARGGIGRSAPRIGHRVWRRRARRRPSAAGGPRREAGPDGARRCRCSGSDADRAALPPPARLRRSIGAVPRSAIASPASCTTRSRRSCTRSRSSPTRSQHCSNAIRRGPPTPWPGCASCSSPRWPRLRTLLFELQPEALESAPLWRLLGQLAETFDTTDSITVETRIDSIAPLPPPTKLGFYRIAQEALSNAARHSGSDVVTVELDETDGVVGLTVHDRGGGFEPAEVAGGHGSRTCSSGPPHSAPA